MRNDGRKNDELRPIKFTHNFTKHALGSVLVEFGDTKVIVTASVDKKKPRWTKPTREFFNEVLRAIIAY